jgi:flagellar FliL protein
MTMPRIMLLILLLNTLITLGGVACNYWMLRPTLAGASVPREGDAHAEPSEPAEYLFFPINKVIVSVRDSEREHYFVLDLVLQADAGTEAKKLERIDPMVRNSAVAHLSAMKFDDIRKLPITDLQASLETALMSDLAIKNIAAPFSHVLVSKMIVQ